MRRELFNRGIITPQTFEGEVHEKALRSQGLEGLHDPHIDEPEDVWETRLARIRDHVTDFYFAYNLPFDLLEQIIRQCLVERGAAVKETFISFNPELAPQRYLFEQGFTIEKMPPEEHVEAEARLQEIKVVLIRTMISDQLSYVNIAKDWFTISDLSEIKRRKIGKGKIGGKAGGMLLAARILHEVCSDDLPVTVYSPESHFVGSDVMYDFMAQNGLMYWLDQKYKNETQIRNEFPVLQDEFSRGNLPPETMDRLREILDQIDHKPIIVRSSSLLEDNFGTSFAGKYESHFCPNQGSPHDNLQSLARAMIRIYASVFNPDALLYRRAKGLQDYDERMALLIQTVEGEQFERYYLPHGAGVAFSRNIYRWSPQIRRDDGFLRLVLGLGTRAVDRTGNDYARMVALSHPTLYPSASASSIRRYSQQFVDVIDLEENTFKTIPVQALLQKEYPILRYLVELDQGEYLVPIRSSLELLESSKMVLTFNEIFRHFPLAKSMTMILQTLEKHYKSPVDTEFTLYINGLERPNPDIKICLLQCRPQSQLKENAVQLPTNLDQENIVFSTPRMVPQGYIEEIRYVIFVAPEGFYSLATTAERASLGRTISILNNRMSGSKFICVGPGRWGASNPDLGINVGYGDIYHARALVEITGKGIGPAPEASYGTHFFQDLVESEIYPLAIYLDDVESIFNKEFFYNTPNRLLDFLPDTKDYTDILRVIEVASFRPQHHLELIMDNQRSVAQAFLAPD
jgi:hypothetical protein